MGILKDFLFKSDEQLEAEGLKPKQTESAPQVVANATASTPQNLSVTHTQQTPTATTASVDNSVDTELLSKMWEYIKDKNIPGPDLLEVKDAATEFEGLGLSHEQMYQRASKIIKKEHPDFNKDNLLKSVDVYIGFADELIRDSMADHSAKQEELIGSKQKEIDNLNKKKIEIAEQINKLTAESEQINGKISNLTEEIKVNTQTLEQKFNKFNVTATYFKNGFLNDKTIIQKMDF